MSNQMRLTEKRRIDADGSLQTVVEVRREKRDFNPLSLLVLCLLFSFISWLIVSSALPKPNAEKPTNEGKESTYGEIE